VSGNAAQAVRNLTAGSVDASGNWWGVDTEAAVQGKLFGSVDFTPFLLSGTDMDTAAAGFQGDFSHLSVTALGSQTGGGDRINEALALVDLSSGQVTVNSGQYDETVTIDRAFSGLTLTGENNPFGLESTDPTVTYVTGGLDFANTAEIDGVTLKNLYLTRTGTGKQRIIHDGAASAAIRDFALQDSVLDGENRADVFGILAAGNFADDFTITGVEIEDRSRASRSRTSSSGPSSTWPTTARPITRSTRLRLRTTRSTTSTGRSPCAATRPIGPTRSSCKTTCGRISG
jgi:hypothetical protein